MSWIVRCKPPTANKEVLIDQIWHLGSTGVAEVEGQLIFGFEALPLAEQAVGMLGEGANLEVASPKMWAKNEPQVVSFGNHQIEIVAENSFGDGNHPTTRLALSALTNVVSGGMSVLDVGCGTGVLTIAAAKLGATTLAAIDNSPEAIETTRANAERNSTSIDLLASDLDKIEHQFDLIVANILLPSHRIMAQQIEHLSTLKGILVLTGFTKPQKPEILSLYPDKTIFDFSKEADWTVISLA